MLLTPDQIQFFKTNGYLVLPKFLSTEEIQSIQKEASSLLEQFDLIRQIIPRLGLPLQTKATSLALFIPRIRYKRELFGISTVYPVGNCGYFLLDRRLFCTIDLRV